MMSSKDYATLGSALRVSLNQRDRAKVFRRICPLLLADNGRFDPHKFGESLGISEGMRRVLLTQHVQQKEVDSNAS